MKYLLLLTLITTAYAQVGEERNSYYEKSFQKHSEMDYSSKKNNSRKYYEKLSEQDLPKSELVKIEASLNNKENRVSNTQLKIIKKGNAKVLIGHIIKSQNTETSPVIILDNNFSSSDLEKFFSKSSIIGKTLKVQGRTPVFSKNNSREVLDHLYQGDEIEVLKISISNNKDSTFAVYAIIDSNLVDQSASKQLPSKARGYSKSVWQGCELNCSLSTGKEK